MLYTLFTNEVVIRECVSVCPIQVHGEENSKCLSELKNTHTVSKSMINPWAKKNRVYTSFRLQTYPVHCEQRNMNKVVYLQQVNKTHLLCLKAMSNRFLNTCSVKNPGISTSYGCIYLAIIKGKFKITTCPSIKWTALHLLNVCFKGVGYGKVSKSMTGKTKQILMFHQLSSVFQS